MHEHAEKLPLVSSLITTLDPRLKILSAVYFIFFTLLTPASAGLTFYFLGIIIFGLVLFCRIPLAVIARRYLVILPFLLVITALVPFQKAGNVILNLNFKIFNLRLTDEGLKIFFIVFVKSLFSICALIVISATTNFTDIIKALKDLKLPVIIVVIISFMYRYLYLMLSEFKKMKTAVNARSFGRNDTARLRALTGCVAVFFLRTYERSEGIYYAMLSRNFKKDFFLKSDFKLCGRDIVFFILFLTAVSLCYLVSTEKVCFLCCL